MYWPRLRLTPEEHKYNSIYEDPGRTQYHVVRRIYPGFLNFNSVVRQDTDTLQISRRSRVFAFTASGDTNLVEVQFSDITGELYTTDYIPLSNLIGGPVYDPRSQAYFNPLLFTPPDNALGTGSILTAATYVPFIFEPNIVLAPNQTVSISGRPIDPELILPIHVDFCLHVWEFPNPEMGSPL